MKKLCVNDNCIGCGACVSIDPEHFDFNENGLSSVIKNENLESENLQNAMHSCPVNAISISECQCGENCNCGPNCNCDENCNCCK